ncbi:MAG: hypothetical protein IT536_10310 [Hyphomicrobiales bacterium]|nr:hypothetical protein [Hyphomicrobiales bacterium]
MSIFWRKDGGPDKAEGEVEGAIYDLVSRDVIEPHRQLAQSGGAPPQPQAGLEQLLTRVSAQSVQEIDTLIRELKSLRDRLKRDSERMARQAAGYATLGEEAMHSSKIIAENLTRWRKPAPADADGAL